jgi:hypothetical protein
MTIRVYPAFSLNSVAAIPRVERDDEWKRLRLHVRIDACREYRFEGLLSAIVVE